MLAIVKHATDANFVFQQHSRPAHGERNTVQLLRCKTQLHYQSYGPSSPELNLNDYITRFMQSYSNVNRLLVASQQY